jgi:bifunctional ADP-heptose synthase (sugar kinase/adenylyltransferase)
MKAGLTKRLGILSFSLLKKVKNENLEFLRWNYKKIVFTNGCFDVIHTGHLKL